MFASVSSSNKENTLAFITHSAESYPSKDPQIDEMQVARRKRRRTSPRELTVLEAEFRKCNKPCRQDREDIAGKVGMSEKAVQIWFQNKRQSARKQKVRPLTPSTPMHPQSLSFDETPTPASRFMSAGLDRPPLPLFNTPKSPEEASSQGSQGSSHASPTPSLPPLRETLAPPRSPKRLRLTMSEDGKAQVSRTPLGQLDVNALPASRAFSMPVTSTELESRENECVNNLLFLRNGKW